MLKATHAFPTRFLPALPTPPVAILAAFAFGNRSRRLEVRGGNSAVLGVGVVPAFAPLVLVIRANAMTGVTVVILSRPNGPG